MPRRQAQKAGDYFWPQSIPIPSSARRTSGKTRHMTSATVDIGSEVGGFRQYRRPRARARLFSFFPFFYSFPRVCPNWYLRYFSTRSFVTRNDRFFVLLCPVVFHCPYLLSLFLPNAAAAPPYFHAFDLTTHVPLPMYFQMIKRGGKKMEKMEREVIETRRKNGEWDGSEPGDDHVRKRTMSNVRNAALVTFHIYALRRLLLHTGCRIFDARGNFIWWFLLADNSRKHIKHIIFRIAK